VDGLAPPVTAALLAIASSVSAWRGGIFAQILFAALTGLPCDRDHRWEQGDFPATRSAWRSVGARWRLPIGPYGDVASLTWLRTARAPCPSDVVGVDVSGGGRPHDASLSTRVGDALVNRRCRWDADRPHAARGREHSWSCTCSNKTECRVFAVVPRYLGGLTAFLIAIVTLPVRAHGAGHEGVGRDQETQT
jgi:hypothetical protein